LEGPAFFAVANSTRKIGMVIFQRRRVIAPSIAPGRIFFNKPLPPAFVAKKKRWRRNFLDESYKTAQPVSLPARGGEQK
jgi:hypothetical protein